MSTHQPVPGGEQTAREWVDLAANLPGAGIVGEAARRRQAEGAKADRSWRVGADGEAAVAALLTELTDVGRWGRLRGRRAGGSCTPSHSATATTTTAATSTTY